MGAICREETFSIFEFDLRRQKRMGAGLAQFKHGF
jgi:hypothetical protein